jgi:hypothetical protein
MRRLLAARGGSAAAVGALMLLGAGGGYALAAGSSGSAIHACVHKHGGDIYMAKRCAKGDKRITWSKVGPQGQPGIPGVRGIQGIQGQPGSQGPGATYFAWDPSGTASTTPVQIGTIGPWAVNGTCFQSGTQTTIEVTITGPGGRTDGFGTLGTTSFTERGTFGPQTNGSIFGGASLTTTPNEESAEVLMIPTSGGAVEVHETFIVTGSTTNPCHVSASVTPTIAQ